MNSTSLDELYMPTHNPDTAMLFSPQCFFHPSCELLTSHHHWSSRT